MSQSSPRLPEDYCAIVVGSGGGIGRAVLERLLTDQRLGRLISVSRRPTDQLDPRHEPIAADITTADGREALSQALHEQAGAVHLVVNAVGLLHDDARGVQPEKRLEELDEAALLALYQINAITPALLLKTLLPHFKGQHPATFLSLSARVGSIGDNGLGGWYGYRASKAAHNMLMKTAAIELKRLNPQSCVLSFHPGTTDTELSRPFQARVPEGKLFSPEFVADAILQVVEQHGPDDSGGFYDWANTSIDW
ncbi:MULTISPECIES: SDR family NAD(P)-dependent oxidoreductase [Halomonas]|uniref:SDR family NAD(P)-dependent oxidoreductase n=1 Tax=Halomonas TaxID=2745 RepID=UPI001C94E06D|nr:MULTISPECIES: SDR family NAD(P)-dependent oxidoreductase [Halomonas]MBY6207004.1 SDR family NAD(P)-dependent oxidoreductase [Halomonas sp. DP3Y7-2]MBY6230478.1 SDR family NAD(P)-dependent oxidoreductase [Halomonas sp. DP3Y7-1]MCA0918639.1 SDR family NAD(P)-dependent oxidoreductase [Halomonas denitrificans]